MEKLTMVILAGTLFVAFMALLIEQLRKRKNLSH
jgi:hypothetical protein